jgi:nucleoside diphosphate kinase
MSATQKIAEIQKIKIAEKYPDNPLMNISADLLKEINSIMATDMAYEDMLTELKDVINKTVSNEQAAELIYNYFKRKLDINKIILSDVSQDHKLIDKIIEIKKLSNEKSEAEKLADILMFPPFGKSITGMFKIQIRLMSMINSTKAAVELYIILAKTGQLPAELPDYLPKDPYTNKNFIYEITDDGFVLSCNSDEFKRGKERFTFKVQK